MKRLGPLVLLVALALVAAGCEWPHHRGGPASTGVSTDEVLLSVGNVAGLERVATRTRPQGLGLSPTVVVAGGRVFDGAGAWDEAMVEGCSGTPRTCAPLWTFAPDGGIALGPVTVADGRVYRATRKVDPYDSSFRPWAGRLEAYDAAGVEGCSGSPKVCQPVWTGQVPTSFPGWSATFGPALGAPTVADGRVYVTSLAADPGLYVFDAAGEDGCVADDGGTPRCVPLFGSIPVLSGTTPSVADGKVFVVNEGVPDGTIPDSGSGALMAFDADGVDGCSGTPVVCQPVWQVPVGGRPSSLPDSSWMSTVPVVDGRVYAGVRGELLVAAADCDTGGAVCEPSWSTLVTNWDQNQGAAIAVVGERILAPRGGLVGVYDVPSCRWKPGSCGTNAVLAGPGGAYQHTAITVANGVVYASTTHGVAAFDLSLLAGCVPTEGGPTCFPLWQEALVDAGMPVVVNGRLYVGDGVFAL